MRLTGYTDRLSAAPGEPVTVYVSSVAATFHADLVRLIHGDPNPLGPGLLTEPVSAEFAGDYVGGVQEIVTGSYVTVPGAEALHVAGGFTFGCWLRPTLLQSGVQVILSHWSPGDAPHGHALVMEDGVLALWLADGAGTLERVVAPAPLRQDAWHFIAASFAPDSGEVRLWQHPTPAWPGDPARSEVTARLGVGELPHVSGPLLLAAMPVAGNRLTGHFNGKMDRPRLFGRALNGDELLALEHGDSPQSWPGGLIAAWDFAQEISTNRIVDTGPRSLHGTAVNMPARGMTGANWTGDESNFRHAPQEYGAIHFHEDDLEDAGWAPSFSFTVPENLPSDIYAVRLQAGDAVDHLPLFVRPPQGEAREPIAFLISTFTYLAYANEHMPVEPLSLFPFADMGAHAEEYAYIAENGLHSLYDTHHDGSGVRYASWKRPLVNMRPDAIFRIYSAPERLGTDLYLTHWLREQEIACDVIADENLHVEGVDLLQPYRVIVTCSHPEYWTAPMLEALHQYLDGGGRVMYLGGNGFYWVTGVDPERPHIIEIRRWRGTETWETEPGEAFLSTTGEQGGLWRNRNRAPQGRLGVGFTSQGNDFSRPYDRLPASDDPRAAFIFEDVPERIIGDFPSLMLRHGAAGYEIDRADATLGTPPHALVLARATGFSDSYQHVVEEVLSTDNERGGTQSPLVRADLVFFEGPRGGAVFSVGSIAWCGSLSYNGGENPVSRVTENVLRRFADPEPFAAPEWTATP